MFAPTKVFRRWHRSSNIKIRRFATRAALSASGIPALIMARGHNIDKVPEVPLVVPNSVEALQKTKDAMKLLKEVGLESDVRKAERSHTIRAGKGKRRNRRYKTRKGPLVIVSKKCQAIQAFRNILGVDMLCVNNLNLLKLCPGGHVGRMIMWTEDAFAKLDKLYPHKIAKQVDSKRVLNSEEVQAVLRKKLPQAKKRSKIAPRPRLNPAAKCEKRRAQRRIHNSRMINANPKLRHDKDRARKQKEKLWLMKVQGKAPKVEKPAKKGKKAPAKAEAKKSEPKAKAAKK